jgi:hypothetical protein
MTVLMPTTPITDAQRDRALRACSVFERFSSAFNRSKVKVTLVADPFACPAPAWSTAEDIYLAGESMDDLTTVEGILGVKGLVLHENLHIKYTPRVGSRLVNEVIERGQFRTFNLLEDQRIETLAVGRYGRAVSRWLIPTVLKHILEGGDITRAFPLLHGRRYLPIELRKAVRQAYAEQDTVARLAELIDQYRAFTFGGVHNIDDALAVIAEVHDLLPAQPEQEHGGCHGNPIPSSPNRPEPKSKQDEAQARDKGEEDDLTDDEDSAEPSETGEDETDDLNEDGQPSPTNDGTPSDSSTDGDTDGDTDGGAPNTNKGGGVSNDTAQRAEDIIQDTIEKSLETVAEEVRNDGRAINGAEFDLDGGVLVDLDKRRSTERAVSASTALAGNAFGRELEELKVAHEANWQRRVKSGKLNLGRIIKGCDVDEAFDKFRVGREDAVDIEAVILLDTSGSMEGLDVVASEAMWAIKRGLDTVKASTTVLTFDTIGERLYDADETAGLTMRHASSRGSTNPLSSLQYARNILAQSERKVKVLFTITDGHWGAEGAPSEEVVEALREGGVLTALVTIGGSSYGDHKHEMTAVVAQPSSLLGLARELTAVATQRNLEA